jgi:hypothetical protein
MGTKRILVALAIVGASLGACTQVERAVRGFETSPGWAKVGESRTAMASDVTYLGASADGLIIVRMADGTTQIWRSGR